MKVKLKGVNFFKAGEKGKTIRRGEGLVILGELEDGRPTTQAIPWNAEIEVKTVPLSPVVTIEERRRG